MKFTGILKSQSSKERLVIVTSPPVTQELFDKFIGGITEEYKKDFSLLEGRLGYVAGTAFDAKYLETILNDAEQALEADKRRAENQRKSFLDGVSKSSGLPLLDDPPSGDVVADS